MARCNLYLNGDANRVGQLTVRQRFGLGKKPLAIRATRRQPNSCLKSHNDNRFDMRLRISTAKNKTVTCRNCGKVYDRKNRPNNAPGVPTKRCCWQTFPACFSFCLRKSVVVVGRLPLVACAPHNLVATRGDEAHTGQPRGFGRFSLLISTMLAQRGCAYVSAVHCNARPTPASGHFSVRHLSQQPCGWLVCARSCTHQNSTRSDL